MQLDISFSPNSFENPTVSLLNFFWFDKATNGSSCKALNIYDQNEGLKRIAGNSYKLYFRPSIIYLGCTTY